MLRGLGFVIAVVALFAAAVALAIHRPARALGFSGLEFAALTPSDSARTPMLAGGAEIIAVMDQSPADRAGIKPGEVVAAIGGVEVTSARQASELIGKYRAGGRAELTLFDIAKGETKPQAVTLVFDAAPPLSKLRSVLPPRTLAKEYFYPPGMAANASWSRRIARGSTIRPRLLAGLGSGHCNGFAPQDDAWEVRGHARDDSLFHVAAKAGFQHALFQSARLQGDPRAFVVSLLARNFGAPPLVVSVTPQPFGFTLLKFGMKRGAAGFVLYRVMGGRIAAWVAAVPAADIAWAEPLVGAVALSLHCAAPGAPALLPRDSALAPTSVSTRCIDGACGEADLAGAYLKTLKLGYVHGLDGVNYLVVPRRDYWINGEEGPGYYHQVGGENEKLEPGRTN